jgi:hypothetical protein
MAVPRPLSLGVKQPGAGEFRKEGLKLWRGGVYVSWNTAQTVPRGHCASQTVHMQTDWLAELQGTQSEELTVAYSVQKLTLHERPCNTSGG